MLDDLMETGAALLTPVPLEVRLPSVVYGQRLCSSVRATWSYSKTLRPAFYLAVMQELVEYLNEIWAEGEL